MVHLLLLLMLSTTTFAQQGASARTMWVTYDKAPLYDSASYMSTILVRIAIGDSVAVTGKQGAFAHVLFGDRSGYLLLSNLGTTPPRGAKRPAAGRAHAEKDSSKDTSRAASRPTTGRAVEPRASEASAPRTQCKALTRSGKQCTRMTSDPSGYCWQHKRN